MNNIKAFNLASADIFALLYGEFPLEKMSERGYAEFIPYVK